MARIRGATTPVRLNNFVFREKTSSWPTARIHITSGQQRHCGRNWMPAVRSRSNGSSSEAEFHCTTFVQPTLLPVCPLVAAIHDLLFGRESGPFWSPIKVPTNPESSNLESVSVIGHLWGWFRARQGRKTRKTQTYSSREGVSGETPEGCVTDGHRMDTFCMQRNGSQDAPSGWGEVRQKNGDGVEGGRQVQ